MTDAKRHSSETLGEQVSRLTRKPPWALSLAEGQELTDLLVALYEQYAALEREIESGVPGRLTVIVPEDRWNELKRVEEQYESLLQAAKAVSQEWHLPDEEPPSETYFHDLIVKLDDVGGFYVSTPASREAE